jgi:dTMP kinase
MSSLFFALDRYDASHDFRDDIGEYDYIIANRYVSSSMIHHGCKIDDTTKRNNFLKWLQNLEYKTCGIPKPDKILFLSMNFENNQKLLQKRAYESGTTELDLHE